MKTEMSTTPLTYEAALKQLQEITTRLEQGKLNIDDLAATLKQANSLLTFCRQKLTTVEADVKAILDGEAGKA